jgi:ubiquinone/menaquinone biosynthesis C-methylase UbiE
MARERVEAMGLGDRITLQKEDLLDLSFKQGQFDYAVCWGVLMHVAEIELALTELHRVLKPGGLLVLSEINMWSAHALIFRNLKKLLGKSYAANLRVPAGIEFWDERESGRFVTRHTDMRWLRRTFERTGFRVRIRTASQFSEIYTRLKSSRVRSIAHAFNRFYFRFCKLPGPALGNIVIAERTR